VWTPELESVQIHFKTGRDLNVDREGKSSALHVCVYQLTAEDAFNSAAADKEKVKTLVECREKLSDEFMEFKEVTLQPLMHVTHFLDRAELAKYIGIIAGYNEKESKVVREIKTVSEKKGWFSCTEYIKPAPFYIDLLPGPTYLKEQTTTEDSK
jgi:type VI secretion system VasD/TssJ family lipoprotein